jgi:cytochrome c oxidase cbb3-type subunit 3
MTSPHDEERLLDHEYDGIREYDNPMPRWWLYTFWGSIVWAALYWFNVPGIGEGKGRIADYDAAIAAAKAEFPAPALTSGPPGPELLAMSRDTAQLAAGKSVFTTTCVPCHGPDGGGVIGPNLTDAYWLHGGTPEAIWKTVNGGVLAKGMPAWGQSLHPEQVNAVVAYVISLRGTKPASPKAPDGVPDSTPAPAPGT